MASRNGKLANLPNDIREHLNLRLLEGETGRELVAWLNALPAVQSVLASQFNGSGISEVNLTHWRQGGYLQWLTERECFDSARALADGDCNLAQTGLSAERLLNILTLRFGELLMRWNLPPDEGVSDADAFSLVAKKARILQAISRSVLAIHRLQSQRCNSSPVSKHLPSPHHPTATKNCAEPCTTDLSDESPTSAHPTRTERQEFAPLGDLAASPERAASPEPVERVERGEVGGLGAKLNIPSNFSHTPFKPDLDLSEILQAV